MSAPRTPALPGPLRLTPSSPFVGRDEELAILDRLVAEALGDGRRVAVVQGEPGSGKTRLVRQAVERAAAAGAGVLYGACDPAGSQPYHPFVEALEQLAERAPAVVEAVASGPHGGELVALLPALASGPASTQRGSPDPGGGRYRLHAAVAAALTGYAEDRGAVLVLDDLHWADAPTLLLLRHLARSASGAPLLVVATSREVEAETAPDLADALAELRRLDGVGWLRLGGLPREAIAELLRRLGPQAERDRLSALAGALADLTGGNAFLVAELGQHLVEAGLLERGAAAPEAIGIPQGVRDVVAQRLARMAPGTRDAVELVAVAGRAVDLAVLRAAAPVDELALLHALDEATGSRLLEEVPGARITYRFQHELLRRAVADRVPSARRAALHLRLATALEAVHGDDDERVAADLADHYAQAGGLAAREQAVRHGLRAAEVAARSFAYEEAARRLRAVLELGVDDAAARGRALCDLGSAQHRCGQVPEALESYVAAADVARRLGDPVLLAQAAIGFEDACWRPGIDDPRAVWLLEEATTAAVDCDEGLRVRLLAGLSRALAYRGDHPAAAAMWRRAVELARRADDRLALAVTLYHAAWTRGSQPPAAVLASLDEARDLFGALGEHDLRHEVDGFRLSLLLEASDTAAMRRGLAALEREVERAGQPFYRHIVAYMGATLAVCDGRFADAERLATQALELSRQLDVGATAIYGIQMFTIRREQGRLAEVAPIIRHVAAGAGDAWGPALALLLAELGMLDEARRELRRLCADDFARVARGGLWLGGLAYLAETCAIVDDPGLAAQVHAELAGLSGKNLVIGQAVACYGATDRFLGMLAATMGDLPAAERHFEAALAHDVALGSPTWLTHTGAAYARMLQRRGRGDDVARARELRAAATATARELGIGALTVGAGTTDGARPDDLSPREVEVLRLVSAGCSNREIGEALHISQHTAANHIRSILLKTGCANRTEAAAYAHRHRLTDR